MSGEHKFSVVSEAVPALREGAPDPAIFFVDLVRARLFLEAEEDRTPRLSAADRERADGMADGEIRALWRTSRIATRIALERVGGVSLRGVAFQIEPGGRPVLGNGAPHFSVSHTDGAALIAISKEIGIGVDLEKADRSLKMSPNRLNRIVQAAERFSPHVENNSDILLPWIWVQLEAAAKALGIGIGQLLIEEGVIGRMEKNARSAERTLAVRTLSLDTDYVGAVAALRLPDDMMVEPFPHDSVDALLGGANHVSHRAIASG